MNTSDAAQNAVTGGKNLIVSQAPDEFLNAAPETKEAIRALVEKRSVDNAPAMPKLKSVVVGTTALGNWDEN